MHRYIPGRSSGGGSPRVTKTQGTRSLAERPFCISGVGPLGERATSQLNRKANGRSSAGRALVSKTGGWGFSSLRPCESWKVPRAPGPRPGREASEQRGTGLTVTWLWGHLSRPRPQRWGVGGEIDSGQHQAGAGPAPAGAVSCRRSDPRRRRRDASAAAHASVGQLAGPPGCRPGPLAGMQVRVLPDALRSTGRNQPMADDGSCLETEAETAFEFEFEFPTERATPWRLVAANPDFQSGPRGFDPRPRHLIRAPMV